MTRDELRRLLAEAPLVASVQASEGAAVDDPETLARMARDSVAQGVRVLRLQGVGNIRAIRAALPGVPTIGLIKRRYEGSEVFITATIDEVRALLALGCEVVALDATDCARPDGASLTDLIGAIHKGGALAMADCDHADSMRGAFRAGADIVSTTLAGYTAATASGEMGPDLALVATARRGIGDGAILLAEGRYGQRWQVEAALQAGADGVVVGGALNDPTKQTRALWPRRAALERAAGFDLGGTWLRFGRYSANRIIVERVSTPTSREARLAWMRDRIAEHGLTSAAVSSGGTIDPSTGEVWEAKPMIPEHVGTVYSERSLGVATLALNDGLATALAHARHPAFAGRRVATLALGTGVGAGFVADGELVRGPRGEYPRLNDLPLPGGGTIEEALGGAALTPDPSAEAKARAIEAFRLASTVLRETLYPNVIVVGGAVGLSPWLRQHFQSDEVPSPFGLDAGLEGAMSLAQWGL